ncbi:uncharacterized protein LOC5578264 [Aedes aegypti]|uniref:Uncharacterized protein n=1 Tax=Aedes aegypti TaxID=7159 RepID=A0A6I8U0L1_AEDAE|nr:uncharacterized protein LOC5578264 [Aedes aegypti]
MRRGYAGLVGCAVVSMVLLSTVYKANALNAWQAAMLNPNVLQMLMNGGFDTRQPARIFLPPKFYSSILYDSGHRSPEEIFRTNVELMMEAVYDDSLLLKQSPSTASLSQADLTSLVAPSGATFNRPNSISYSDGSTGNRNKGSGALEKNTVTNFKSSSASTPGKTMPSPIVSYQIQSGVPQIGSRIPTGGKRQNFDSTRDPAQKVGLGYNLRSALPGEPDVDYPILGRIPDTSFKCHGRRDGYYADVEARCQVFRVCANTDDSGSGFAFLCPNGTLFNQRYFVCDWYMNVRCAESENYYSKNEELGKTTTDFGKMMGAVMSMVGFPMMSKMMAAVAADDVPFNNVRPSSLNDDISSNGKNSFSFNMLDFVGGNQPSFGQDGIKENLIPSKGGVKGGVFQSKFNKESSYQAHMGKDVTHPANQVYVSSLGTLSTDPQSGFDPVKSTFLAPSVGLELLPPRLTSSLKVPTIAQKQKFNEEINSAPPMPKAQFELLMGKLLKTWTDKGYAKTFSPRPQTPKAILPPSGVLPPSPLPLGTNRLQFFAGKSQIAQTPPAPRNPNPTTVQNVIRVNKVFVAPQSYRPSSYVTFSQTPIPQSVAQRLNVGSRPIVNPSSVQISRRNGIPVQRILRPAPLSASAIRREIGYDIEIVPSNGYYLNNKLERNSYFDALNKQAKSDNGLNYFSGLSSYNVPISSIGPKYNKQR